MTDTPRTDLITKIYNRISIDERNESIASIEQIEACFDDGLDEIARWKCISGQEGTATVEANSNLLILPPDWLINNLANKNILRAISQGRDPRAPRTTNPPLRHAGGRYGNNSYGFGFNSRFSPTSRSMIAPLTAPCAPDNTPEARSQLVDGIATPVFTLPYASDSARSWQLLYNARYTVLDAAEDSPAINTFPEGYNTYLFRVIAVLIGGSRAFDLDTAGGNRDPLDTLDKQEDLIRKICSRLASRGRNR